MNNLKNHSKDYENQQESNNKLFLVLSLYYFFIKNGYENTANSLIKETNLDKVIIFNNPNDDKSIENELRNYFIQFLFMNDVINNPSNKSFLSDHWINFWNFFFNKIEASGEIQENQQSDIEKYLSKFNKVKTYSTNN